MFKILGTDGKEYGPVDGETLRQWIKEGRANGRTRVQAAGDADWRELGEMPDFADALAVQAGKPLPPPLPPPSKSTASPDGRARISGMAIASLVLGLIGFCFLPAIPGVILGIVALGKIKRSGGRLAGRGIAIAGICVSAVMLLFSIPFIAGLTLPALAKAKRKAESASCANNARQVSLAIRLYADDHDGRCPPAANWCDAVSGNLSGPEAFRCPQRRGDRSGFAFNAKLGGRMLSSIPPDVVLVFESSGGWNFAGGPGDLLASPPHGRTFVFGFADGSVREVPREELPDLRWEP